MMKQFEDEKVNDRESAAETSVGEEKMSEKEQEASAEQAAPAEEENYYEHIRRVREEQNAPKKRSRKKEILIIAVAMIIAAVLLIGTRGFTEELKWQKVEGSAHQYYGGASTVITGDTELKVNDDGKVISKNNENEKIADLPIYYDDRDAVIITETYVYYAPREDVDLQAETLTEFYLDKGTVHAVKGGKDSRVERGFLYNGKDKFIFLEPMTVEINNTTIELPALSYVEADPYGDVTIFNYDTKETETVRAKTEAQAYPPGKPYTLEMLSDSIVGPDGIRVLLFFAPEKLDKLL